MVATTFTLRPSADISVGHTMYPEGSTAGYLLINEEVSDEASTYLEAKTSNDTTATTTTSSFKLSGDVPSDDIVVTGVYIYYSTYKPIYGSSSGNVTLNINGVSLTPLNISIGYNTYNTSSSDAGDEAVSAINNYILSYGSFPEITVSVESTVQAKENESKGGTDEGIFRISQLYLNITYHTGVYRKVSATWKPAFQLYQMVDGSWAQISSVKAKSILQSNYIKSGHSQTKVAGTSPTCTTTGLTTGYVCSICGETIVEQEVIPANGHTSVIVNGYAETCGTTGLTNGQKCSVCGTVLVAQETIPATGNHNYVYSGGYDEVCGTCGHINGFGFASLSYYGTATSLSEARSALAATTVGNYALFGGGGNDSSVVDAYDTSLTRSIPTSLSEARDNLVATTVGNYALFGGGYNTSVVDAYNQSLTRTNPTSLSEEKYDLAATTVGNYALFGGGELLSNSSSTVDAYDTSLTRSIPTSLSEARSKLAATTVGNYALFGGGYKSSVVDAYDTSLTRSIPTSLSEARTYMPAATTVGNYALFGGGDNYSSTIDAYNQSLTRTNPTSLSEEKYDLAATTVGNYALFGGGVAIGSSYSTVDAYNQSLTRTNPTSLSEARHDLSATTVGNYALFGGGIDGDYLSTVDIYQIQSIS